MSENCYFCGEPKPPVAYLRDEKSEDHPVCKDCYDKWAESDQEWPQPTNKK